MSNVEVKHDSNKNLYEFFATSYDISNLACRIDAAQKASMNLINLRKICTDGDSNSA